MLYAQTPARRTRQLLVDLAVLGWIAAWVFVAQWLHEQLLRLAGPGRSLQSAGRGLADSLDRAGERVDDLPLAGDTLSAPFRAGGDAGRTLESAGRAQQSAVDDIALWVALLVAVLALLFVVPTWLRYRLRWVREATAAAKLRGRADSLDLFALRALVRQPMSQLRRAAYDPAEGWRRGDPETVRALAELELRGLGLRTEPRRRLDRG